MQILDLVRVYVNECLLFGINQMNLKDKHVVVTGGTGALGTAVVERLVTAGAICHIPNYDENELADFSFSRHPQVKISSAVDLTDAESVEDFFDQAPGLWASIHLAGGFLFAPIEETSAADLDTQWRMNARTSFLCCRSAVKAMRRLKEGRGGRIVNVAARPALELRQGANMIAYTMAKAAVAALSQALAEEVAAEQIWVNAIAPSILDTAENRAAMPDEDHDKWPTLEDVAETILFLASPGNRTTRGGIIPVYGQF
jgi:NAD(P)-dependent dehydrogenase (short-subunit alcohol dehydrogenase family)